MTPLMTRRVPALLALPLVMSVSACGLNSIPTSEETAKARWADVQNEYQRRADLIPNLVATVKGYAKQESDVLTRVTEARASANRIQVTGDQLTDPAAVQRFAQAQNAVTLSLQRLQEAYPDLESNQNFLSLQSLLGYVLSPIAWVIGVPWQDATIVGSLIGQKVVLNEFVAYIGLADIINGHAPGLTLSPQGTLIATYALCGFANFSSIAIQIGGIGGLAPERRGDIARFGMRAVLGGSIATFMTATIAGVLTQFG